MAAVKGILILGFPVCLFVYLFLLKNQCVEMFPCSAEDEIWRIWLENKQFRVICWKLVICVHCRVQWFSDFLNLWHLCIKKKILTWSSSQKRDFGLGENMYYFSHSYWSLAMKYSISKFTSMILLCCFFVYILFFKLRYLLLLFRII